MSKRTKILFVCLGNICRSPLAEAIFKHKIANKGIHHFFEADSCGTSNYHIGGKPDGRTIQNAAKNGVSIEHLGRQLCDHDLEYFDYILVMDSSNHSNIMKLKTSSQHQNKIYMMRDFDPIENGDVPDPYYGGEKGFQEVFDILDRSIENFIEGLGVQP